jgi:hypothetical protein
VSGPVPDRHRRNGGHAEAPEFLERSRIGLNVDGVELDPPRREEFPRLGAGRSAGTVEEARARHHRPQKVGVCLLANAVTPAAKSWVWPLAAMACASSSICVSKLSHVDW